MKIAIDENNPDYNAESTKFLTEQIITYIGNKRSLLSFIGSGINIVKESLGKKKLSCFDVFSGSGVVSRFLKQHSICLYANDIESYSRVINECYLTNRSEVDFVLLNKTLMELQSSIENKMRRGIIADLYAPKDQKNISDCERVFYSTRNAMYIDTARLEIDKISPELQKYFLAPLIYGASVHNNTSGVFKGFYKNKEGIGQYGGTGKNALKRILGEINIQLPVFSNFECDYRVMQMDALDAARSVGKVDFAYLDPPYNQHPYGSNYFMLNLIVDYKYPSRISTVSGIPKNWKRSLYNKRKEALRALLELIECVKAKYVLISYNSEGFVKHDDFVQQLTKFGCLQTLSTDYNAFRGSRNLSNRDIYVKEYLFLLKKN